jgi:hypothetical protein
MAEGGRTVTTLLIKGMVKRDVSGLSLTNEGRDTLASLVHE